MIQADSEILERKGFLRAYKKVSSRPVESKLQQSSPGLLWRENRECEGLQTVAEGSEGVQQKEAELRLTSDYRTYDIVLASDSWTFFWNLFIEVECSSRGPITNMY